MNLKNLFLLIFLAGHSLSSFSISPHRHLQATQYDSSAVKKPYARISEMDQNQLLLLDATVELDQALLAGIEASLDTLNVPIKSSIGKIDTVERLRMIKRKRERTEMRDYLNYMKDSLTTECAKLNKEKESMQIRLGLTVVQKKEIEHIKDKQLGIPDTSHVAMLTDKNNKIPDVALKKDKKHVKQKRNANAIATDTILALSDKGATPPKPVAQINTVSTADTTTGKQQAPPAKADISGDQQKTLSANIVSQEPDTAVRIKSRYYTAYAQKSIIQKDYPKALDYVNSSLNYWKDNYEAWFTKASIDAQNGNFEKAMEDYQQCYRIDSSKPTLFYNMAIMCLQLHNTGNALSNLNKAIALDGNYTNAYMKRASIYNDATNYRAAITDYDYILKTDRNYYNAYKGRGIAKLMERKYKEAVDDFTRYLMYDQADAEVYYYRGIAKISDNEWLDGCLELSMSANMGYGPAAVAQKKNCE